MGDVNSWRAARSLRAACLLGVSGAPGGDRASVPDAPAAGGHMPQAARRLVALVHVQVGDCRVGLNLELVQYTDPDQVRVQPRNSDVDGIQLALCTYDFEVALAHLVAHGVQIMGEPTVHTTGPRAGQTWVYFSAPCGLRLELVSARPMRFAQRTSPRHGCRSALCP
ncbi:VOC family protein [Streptomyces sp. NPDC005181]|uniref:VOC family protein n=1 Tax=Streptomyces sp. NPDC005181 TaxID=3156869 RepID=UPI0033ADE502